MPEGEPSFENCLSGKREPDISLTVHPGNRDSYEEVALSKRGRGGLGEYLTGLAEGFLDFSTILFLISIFICQAEATPIIEGQKEQAGKQGGG
jgi:hypothetical protein